MRWINTAHGAVNLVQVCRIEFRNAHNDTDEVDAFTLYLADRSSVFVDEMDPGFDAILEQLEEFGFVLATPKP